MKKIILCVLVILMLNLSTAFTKATLVGFQGIDWGMNFNEVADQFTLIEEESQGDLKSYHRNDNATEITEHTTADEITYQFWKDKFLGIYAENCGYKAYLIIDFLPTLGQPTYNRHYEHLNHILWQDDICEAYYEGRNFGKFTIYNLKIREEMQTEGGF